MKTLVLALIFLPSVAFAQSGEFRGFKSMENMLKDRVVNDPYFTIISLFQFPQEPYDFYTLLGTYDGYTISPGTIQNGTPNAFNMILWQTIMNNLSHRLGKECQRAGTTGDRLQIHAHLAQTLKSLCAWPLPSAKDVTVYETLFNDISMYDIPAQEFDAWYDHFVASGNFDELTSEKFIKELMYPLLMNPYFLLQP